MNKLLQKFNFLWEKEDIFEYVKDFDKENKIKFYTKLINELLLIKNNYSEKEIELFVKKNKLGGIFKKEKQPFKNTLRYNKFWSKIYGNLEMSKYELIQLNTKIENYIEVEYLMNQNTFIKYNKFKYGFYEDDFIRVIESIKNIEDKIIFLNFINSQIDNEIENINFILGVLEVQIKNYVKDERTESLDTLYRKFNDYEEEIACYELSKGFIYEMIQFWKEQYMLKEKKFALNFDKNENTESINIKVNETKDLKNKKVNELLKKFKFQGTEKSLLIIIDLLYNSGFISNDDYSQANAILRDTFLNKKGNPFNNKQLAVARKKMDDIKKEDLVKPEDDDFTKFLDLSKSLSKQIKY